MPRSRFPRIGLLLAIGLELLFIKKGWTAPSSFEAMDAIAMVFVAIALVTIVIFQAVARNIDNPHLENTKARWMIIGAVMAETLVLMIYLAVGRGIIPDGIIPVTMVIFLVIEFLVNGRIWNTPFQVPYRSFWPSVGATIVFATTLVNELIHLLTQH
jgi:hypothetical protein